ncbi:Arm DNA-binding domain-containing protein [Planktotalea sp.]|uniref:Arm DNA-binding domain-containing protein n=1 Tax=Planktotalea sp. TaxID=2029877 RepID=UPI0035C82646
MRAHPPKPLRGYALRRGETCQAALLLSQLLAGPFPSTPFRIIQIRNIKSRDKPYNLRDFEGLLVLFKIIGSKFRRFKCRPDGNEGLLVIGGYPAVSLAQACKTHDLAKALMADGIDPNEAKTRPSCTTNTVKNRNVSRECSAGSKID